MSKRKAPQRQRCYYLTVYGLNDLGHRWGRLPVTKPDGSTWDTDVPRSGR